MQTFGRSLPPELCVNCRLVLSRRTNEPAKYRRCSICSSEVSGSILPTRLYKLIGFRSVRESKYELEDETTSIGDRRSDKHHTRHPPIRPMKAMHWQSPRTGASFELWVGVLGTRDLARDQGQLESLLNTRIRHGKAWRTSRIHGWLLKNSACLTPCVRKYGLQGFKDNHKVDLTSLLRNYHFFSVNSAQATVSLEHIVKGPRDRLGVYSALNLHSSSDTLV